jgi:hypothetical protein
MKCFGAMPNQPLLQSQASSTPVVVSRTDHHTRDGRQPWVLETGVAALPTVAKLIRGFDGIVQKSRILPHAVGLEWQGF